MSGIMTVPSSARVLLDVIGQLLLGDPSNCEAA